VPERTVLVLGCGMAGAVAARELRRLLPDHRVVAIDRGATAFYAPSFPALAVGETRARSLQRPRARLARHGIEVVNATVQHVDTAARVVKAEGRELRYDYLVVALGAEADNGAIPGVTEATQGFYTFEAAERLGAALRYFAGGRVLITVPEGRFRWPPAPYEMAMLLEQHFHVRKMRQKVEIGVVTPEPAPLAALGEETSDLIAGQLAHKGIEVNTGATLAAVDPVRRLAHLADGAPREFDLLIAIRPHRAPPVLVESGLADDDGWVEVDPATMETGQEGVFAVGDAALPRGDGHAFMSITRAKAEAAAAAGQIAARVRGAPPSAPPVDRGRWFIEVGAGAAVMVSGDFGARPPRVQVAQPSIVWHWAKTALEKYWLSRWW
jgi:sulfide:quinone oxidoreductase